MLQSPPVSLVAFSPTSTVESNASEYSRLYELYLTAYTYAGVLDRGSCIDQSCGGSCLRGDSTGLLGGLASFVGLSTVSSVHGGSVQAVSSEDDNCRRVGLERNARAVVDTSVGISVDQVRIVSSSGDSAKKVGFGKTTVDSKSNAFELKRGKHYAQNKSRRERGRELKRNGRLVGFRGSCETVVSQAEVGEAEKVPLWRRGRACRPSPVVESLPSSVSGQGVPVLAAEPSVASASVSSARDVARETLDLRRVAENRLAARLAEVRLAGLNDVSRTADLNDLRKQQVIQWRNESVAKSQASLDKVKSVEPGSSISQSDIRAIVKENEDLKFRHELLFDRLNIELGLEKTAEILRDVKPLTSEEELAEEEEAQFFADNFD